MCQKQKTNPTAIFDFCCKTQNIPFIKNTNYSLRRLIAHCSVYFLMFGLLQIPTLSFGGSWIEEHCRQKAAEYDALASFKKIATPEHVAKVYSIRFSTKGAGREAQAIWRLMHKDNISAKQAIKIHFERYHSKRSTDEKELLRKEINQQINFINIIHDLVLAFEKEALTDDFVISVMSESWHRMQNNNNWGAPKPIEHYLNLIQNKYDSYTRSGIDKEEAAVRAAVDTRNTVDRDRGVSSKSIIDTGHVCYKDELYSFELWLRKAALDPLTEEEARDVMENTKFSQKLSRLTYYTEIKFGPRDYSYDRFNTWKIAADEISNN